MYQLLHDVTICHWFKQDRVNRRRKYQRTITSINQSLWPTSKHRKIISISFFEPGFRHMLLSNLLLKNQNTFSKISKFQTNSVAFKGLKIRELSWKNMMETTLTPAPFDAPNVREQIYRWNGPVKGLSGKWSIWVLMGWLLPRMFLKCF